MIFAVCILNINILNRTTELKEIVLPHFCKQTPIARAPPHHQQLQPPLKKTFKKRFISLWLFIFFLSPLYTVALYSTQLKAVQTNKSASANTKPFKMSKLLHTFNPFFREGKKKLAFPHQKFSLQNDATFSNFTFY